MGIVNNDKVLNASQDFRAAFIDELMKQTPWALQAAERFTCLTTSVSIPWMELLGDYEEFKGLVEWQAVAVQDVTITPKDYRFPVEVPMKAIDDDIHGIFTPRFRQMGIKAGNLPNKLLGAMIIDCYSGTKAYDGVAFFGAHSGCTNYGTDVLDSDAIDTLIGQMSAGTGADGQPLNFEATHLWYGAGSKGKAETILDCQFISSTANKHYKKYSPIYIPQITGNDWGFFDLSKGIKPYGYMSRQDPDFNAVISPDSVPVKDRKHYQYYSDARVVPFPLYWQLACASTGDGT
jgi:phage major head subunit gpT-like protein